MQIGAFPHRLRPIDALNVKKLRAFIIGSGTAAGVALQLRNGFISKLNATFRSDGGVAFSSESVTVWCVCTLKFFDAQYAYRVQKIAGIISLQGGNFGNIFHHQIATATERQFNSKDMST